MIELFSKKRMLIGILALGGLSIIIIILENRNLHTLEEDIHDWHPDLKAKLTPDDKCWKNESFSILEKCDLCSGDEIKFQKPLVCVAKGQKELVECKKSGIKTYRSCDRVDWVEERRFWTFEGLLTLLGFVSGLAVFIRQKQLDHRMYQRIQKQIASGV